MVAELDGSGSLQRRYVYGPGTDQPIAMIMPDGSREYYHYDGKGTVIATTDDSGALVASYIYDPYGKSDDLSGNPYRFKGRRLDFETGFYYNRARYYSPSLGRFLNADPIGYGDGLNMYAYAGNDPVNSSDPSGLKKDDEDTSTPEDMPNITTRPQQGSTPTYTSTSMMAISHFDVGGIGNVGKYGVPSKRIAILNGGPEDNGEEEGETIEEIIVFANSGTSSSFFCFNFWHNSY